MPLTLRGAGDNNVNTFYIVLLKDCSATCLTTPYLKTNTQKDTGRKMRTIQPSNHPWCLWKTTSELSCTAPIKKQSLLIKTIWYYRKTPNSNSVSFFIGIPNELSSGTLIKEWEGLDLIVTWFIRMLDSSAIVWCICTHAVHGCCLLDAPLNCQLNLMWQMRRSAILVTGTRCPGPPGACTLRLTHISTHSL